MGAWEAASPRGTHGAPRQCASCWEAPPPRHICLFKILTPGPFGAYSKPALCVREPWAGAARGASLLFLPQQGTWPGGIMNSHTLVPARDAGLSHPSAWRAVLQADTFHLYTSHSRASLLTPHTEKSGPAELCYLSQSYILIHSRAIPLSDTSGSVSEVRGIRTATIHKPDNTNFPQGGTGTHHAVFTAELSFRRTLF